MRKVITQTSETIRRSGNVFTVNCVYICFLVFVLYLLDWFIRFCHSGKARVYDVNVGDYSHVSFLLWQRYGQVRIGIDADCFYNIFSSTGRVRYFLYVVC